LGTDVVNTVLVYPPMADVTQPYLSLPTLAGALVAGGLERPYQYDANVEFFHDFLRPASLQRGLSAARAELARLNRLERVPDQAAYNRLGYLAARGEYLVRHAASALTVFRTRSLFDVPEHYEWAAAVLDDALALASAAFAPTRVRAFEVATASSPFSSAELLAAAADPSQNPFIDFYERVALPELSRHDPELVGISVTYVSQMLGALTLARLVKAHRPRARVVVGGAYISCLVGRLPQVPALAEFVDYFVVHEGETALVGLARSLATGGAGDGVPNLLRTGRAPGRALPVVGAACGPPRLVEDIGRSAGPDYTGVDFARYLSPAPTAMVDITRGCYWSRCAFCAYGPGVGPCGDYRPRDPAGVVHHLRELRDRFGVEHAVFSVDAVAPRDLTALAHAIRAADLDVRWQTTTRVEKPMDPAFFRTLHAAGCRSLIFGVESGCDEILAAMDKGNTVAQIERVFTALAGAGITNKAMLIIGFPSETRDQALLTRDFLLRNRDLISFVSLETFSLLEGALVLADPGRYGVTRAEPDGADLSFGYRYEVERGLGPAEAAEVFREVWAEVLDAYDCQPYPFTRSGAGVHTLLHSESLGRDRVARAPADVRPPPGTEALIEAPTAAPHFRVHSFDPALSGEPVAGLACTGPGGDIVPLTATMERVLAAPERLAEIAPEPARRLVRYLRHGNVPGAGALTTPAPGRVVRIPLTADQRNDLGRRFARRVEHIDVDPGRGLFWPAPSACTRCLLHEGLGGVVVGEDGVCNFCRAEAATDPGAAAGTLDRLAAELRSAPPVLAYSGGRDSTVTLALLCEWGVDVAAVLIDNGFIPGAVRARAAAACTALGVPLRSVRVDIGRTVRQFLRGESSREPCQVCIGRGLRAMGREARRLGRTVVVTGHKYPPVRHGLDLLTRHPSDTDLLVARPLCVRPVPAAERQRLLDRTGWVELPLEGNTSNCALPAALERHFGERYGYPYAVFELSREVRGGAVSRAEAEQVLRGLTEPTDR
jgi:hypothetical protein